MFIIISMLLACSHDHDVDPVEKGGVLNIYVYPADDPMVTRADDGMVDATTPEQAVKSLKIWVFKHGGTDDDQPLHYLSPSEPELQGSRARLFQIPLTEQQVKVLTADDGQVDFYVLANAESVGQGALDATSTRAAVRDAVIASDYFGTTSLATASVISTNGLPMSGYGENISVQGSYPVLSLPVVKLTRCVSKLRFVLCQNEDADSEISITSLQLDGNQIPTTENVFNRTSNPYSISSTYIADALPFTFPPNFAVAKYERLIELVYRSQEAQDYEDIIDKVVADEKATQLGPYYFRESDKCLTGSIGYEITEIDNPSNIQYKTATFSMSDVPGNYNFSRNHTWTIYVYYLGGEELEVVLVYVKNWSEADTQHGLYNW